MGENIMSQAPLCFFCERHPTVLEAAQQVDGYFYNCPFCGRYILEREAEQIIRDKYYHKRHMIAGYLHYLKGKSNKTSIINADNYSNYLENGIIPKTVMEKLDKLLVHFYLKSDSIGEQYNLKDYINEPELFFAKDNVELAVMLDELSQMGLIYSPIRFFDGGNINIGGFSLTVHGCSHAENYISTTSLSKKVFVAMGFMDDLLQAKDEAIKPACSACGFEADVVSQFHNGDITDKIISEIKASRFVVCDFTYGNQGAYNEAGFARGLGLPVICCCKREWFEEIDNHGARKNKLHFDVEHLNMIFWSTHDELQEKLIDRIRATIL